jgi:Centromere DNA-binding protein complex CBF3 subunit, domain 2
MIMTMRQRKQNQHGKIEYMGCMRNTDPILCPLSALAFYFFNRWGRHGAQPFPSFRQPEDYYNHYAFPGSVRVSERPLTYAMHLYVRLGLFRFLFLRPRLRLRRRLTRVTLITSNL